MTVDLDSVLAVLKSILSFPAVFQQTFIEFAWGSGNPTTLLVAKRLLLLLPVLGFVFCCWMTVGSLASLPFRSDRNRHVSSMLSTWWDFGRAVVNFWGGSLKFLYVAVGSLIGLFRILVLGMLLFTQDVLFFPLRVAKEAGQEYFRPGIPWIAVIMTLGWCALEAGVFTYVTMPMVTDVMSAIHDGTISSQTLPIVLYCMMLAFVLGSYAILSSWGEVIKNKNVPKIIQIGIFESFVMLFEVLFLYREFVDALVPWLNQYTSGGTSIGLVPILAISTFAWLGIRGMTWFLFASAGTPTIMAIIQRTGIPGVKSLSTGRSTGGMSSIRSSLDNIRKEMGWVQDKGEELLAAFILPPLQIVGACINFCVLLFQGKHMFILPFTSTKDLIANKPLVEKITPHETRRAA